MGRFHISIPMFMASTIQSLNVQYRYICNTYTVRVIYIVQLCLPILDYVTCTIKILFFSKGCFQKNSVQPNELFIHDLFMSADVTSCLVRRMWKCWPRVLCHEWPSRMRRQTWRSPMCRVPRPQEKTRLLIIYYYHYNLYLIYILYIKKSNI